MNLTHTKPGTAWRWDWHCHSTSWPDKNDLCWVDTIKFEIVAICPALDVGNLCRTGLCSGCRHNEMAVVCVLVHGVAWCDWMQVWCSHDIWCRSDTSMTCDHLTKLTTSTYYIVFYRCIHKLSSCVYYFCFFLCNWVQLVVTAVVVWVHWRLHSIHVAATPSADASGHVAILYEGNVRWSCVSTQQRCRSRRSSSNITVSCSLFYSVFYFHDFRNYHRCHHRIHCNLCHHIRHCYTVDLYYCNHTVVVLM